MSESDRLHVRISRAFKSNTQDLVDRLYMLEIREDTNLTAYVIEAIKEKRERDEAMLELKVVRNKTDTKTYVQAR